MIKEEVILVDENDQVIGSMEKLQAHQEGILHRAFSVFIFNEKGEMLLQQRALTKYHSAGLWTNACCSHPRPGEDTLHAAHRRLKEEMGLKTGLTYKGNFTYRSEFENGLTEHEFDHIYTGITNNEPYINPEEVNAYAWKKISDIKREIVQYPERFTTWFRMALDKWF